MAAPSILPPHDLARRAALLLLLGQAYAAGPLRAPFLPPTTAGPVPLLTSVPPSTPIPLLAFARWESAAGPELADRVARRLWSLEPPPAR
jgi:hypothetical protein